MYCIPREAIAHIISMTLSVVMPVRPVGNELWTRANDSDMIAFFFGSATLAGAFGGALAFAIMDMEGLRGSSGWQCTFIIEALPPLFLPFVTYYVMSDSLSKARFLNKREREIAIYRLQIDAGPAVEASFSWNQFKDMGYDSFRAHALTTPPYAVGGHTKRAVGVAMVSNLGNIGGVLSGHVYTNEQALHYVRGYAICLSMLLGVLTMCILLKYALVWVNKRRDNFRGGVSAYLRE
ncbi:hypothetical protein BDB00DRAFT_876961 [Zychaea mexicana]|uniref:uncharacterized protein n=1 Tax=Zychaea mexicana TaxID=64656 RepID=UPI0022FF3864|nr:uncharacterized protein BDB00DRAFT_876961 [Zychaea mexicana]KAI9488895.1 hypothetical protein BDB00DRAFT_876961 [Zychaea mexicana]